MSNIDRLIMLVIEDNPADVILLREALLTAGRQVDMHVVEDGRKGLAFLRRLGGYAQAPRPHVVVLDLNLPIKSGREVLEDLATGPGLTTIPVAVFTSSRYDGDVCSIYPDGMCSYFVKTGQFNALVTVAEQICAFALSAGSG